ncbi:MAG: phosphoribosylformylglycinamidine synthase, partial [Nitrospirae bacterium]|nr:phosphoribosylformylglycinamidine synthase [Nitrospirota bacterium]
MDLMHFYRTSALSEAKKNELLSIAKQKISSAIEDIETEYCFNIEANELIKPEEMDILRWLLSETFEPENFSENSFLTHHSSLITHHCLLEVGPRMNFTTAWSTNAVAVCHACGLTKIKRIERSRRYKFIFSQESGVRSQEIEDFYSSLVTRHSSLFFDRMTECPYPGPLTTFASGVKPEPVFEIRLKEEGKSALEKINKSMGLGLDDWDIDYYYNLFVHDIGRNPTNVECFDLSQSNSEHSRHWFFKGRLIVDGKEVQDDLIRIIQRPLKANPSNSVIAFKDNSSSIKGYEIDTLIPENPQAPSPFQMTKVKYDSIFTAETHNFPSGVAPFPGAETGTGGRIRDVEATGRGGL